MGFDLINGVPAHVLFVHVRNRIAISPPRMVPAPRPAINLRLLPLRPPDDAEHACIRRAAVRPTEGAAWTSSPARPFGGRAAEARVRTTTASNSQAFQEWSACATPRTGPEATWSLRNPPGRCSGAAPSAEALTSCPDP